GCDVTDEHDCRAAIERVVATWGGVDVLVANAGISHRSLFAETDVAVLRRVVDVNLFGAIHATQAALPSLLARRGIVIGVSSVAGFAPLVGRTGYAASKHALHGFFDSLRAELHGTGVDVMLVCPSFVATAIERHAVDGGGRPLGDGPRAVSGRVMTPEALAHAVVRAAAKRRRLVLPSALSRAAWWLSRLAPRLYEASMRRTQGGEFEAAPRPSPRAVASPARW
ncbi:MAG: SDR family oxidoreductase, partial [Myxococcales bacterium]|nr:SDR family oxidoreductase [Myxococcales bacterium]